MSRWVLGLAASALCPVLLTSDSDAVNVPAGGGAVPLPGATAAAQPDLAGVVVEDVSRPFSVGAVTGYIQDRIVRSNNTGQLDFCYRVVFDANAVGRVTAVRRSGFAPASTTIDADWRMDGLGTRAPKSAQRSADGASVSFSQAGSGHAIGAGESSRFVYIGTSATNYQLGGQTILVVKGGGGSVSVKTFSPAY